METVKKWFDTSTKLSAGNAHHRQAKWSFIIVSLIILLISSVCGAAEAACRPYNKLSEEEKNRIDGTGNYSIASYQQDSYSLDGLSGIFAGSAEGFVYRYDGGTDWRIVSPDLGGSVLCIVEYQNTIYAGTRDGKVWKTVFSPGTGYIWTEVMFPSGQEPGQVNALIEYRGELYAGTSSTSLFCLHGSDQWEFVTTADGFAGIRCLYVYQDILFLGDIAEDRFGHYVGNVYTYDGCYGTSCIWDFQEYHNRLYAGSYEGDVYRLQEPLPNPSELFNWGKVREPDGYDTWELETFQDLLYVSHGRELLTYNGDTFSKPVVVIPDENPIIAMLTRKDGENLLIGVGKEMGYGSTGTVGRIYLYNGIELISISGEIGAGIQCFLDTTGIGIQLTKTDDVNDGNCVGPGREINYRIDYNYPSWPNFPDINDVNIIDYLPDEVEFISSEPEPNEIIDSNIIWHIGTLSPGESGFVTLKVKVKCPEPGGTIKNKCKLKSGDLVLRVADENTPVCCCPTILKVDDINADDCVGSCDNFTYSICYAANGYGDTNVVIIDPLPSEVDFVSATGDWRYESGTVTWNIGTLEPNESSCVTVTVEVKGPQWGSTITNRCEMKGDCIDINDYENTSVCRWCPIYVDVNANGWNNGYLWENAFTNLQDALKVARGLSSGGCSPCPCADIWVAEGTYRPDQNSVEPNGTGDRTATFGLINGVAIYGGFPAGGGEWEDRNPAAYETILSGDLEGNDREGIDPCDLLNDPCRAENSYHVVTGSGTDETAILDGFTITGGNANGDDPYNNGGGMFNSGGSPTVRNCTFVGNGADYGGGGMCVVMCVADSNTTVTNCTFVGNSAQYGGGICGCGAYGPGDGSLPQLTNCTFIGNWAQYAGGICGSSGTVTNCILWDNEGGQIRGNATVTYSDIQGGWAGVGNINEDPILEADGLHLMMCSPCIDAGTNEPNGGLPAEDIDGENRIMNGRCVGEAIVDMGADEYYLEDCNVLEFAHCPRPACGETDVPRDVVLSWRPGIDANTHDVYFGTDKIKVTDANRDNPLGVLVSYDQNDNTYDPCGLLDLDRTYYWRIDEVNDACEPYLWEGDVWHFRTRNYLVVEDFDSYADDDALRDVWKSSGYVYISLQLGENDANLVRDGNSMQYYYDNYGQPYSEAYANTAALPSGIGSNWTISGVKALVLYFYGQADNDVSEPMYVKLTDGDSPAHSKTVNYDGDMNDIRKEEWQEWNIALTEFTNVNLANVSRITIGFGNGIAEFVEDKGTVYFEDIRLYTSRCVPERPTADLNWDCVVDFRDFAVLANEWLDTGCCEADLYEDYKVDFKDLAIMADNWLEEGQLWP